MARGDVVGTIYAAWRFDSPVAADRAALEGCRATARARQRSDLGGACVTEGAGLFRNGGIGTCEPWSGRRF